MMQVGDLNGASKGNNSRVNYSQQSRYWDCDSFLEGESNYDCQTVNMFRDGFFLNYEMVALI